MPRRATTVILSEKELEESYGRTGIRLVTTPGACSKCMSLAWKMTENQIFKVQLIPLQYWPSPKIAFRLPSEAGVHAQLAHAVINRIDS